MGVRITSQEDRVAIFDSVSGYAFGPTFESEEDAEEFLEFMRVELHADPRELTDDQMGRWHSAWSIERARRVELVANAHAELEANRLYGKGD